MSVTTEPVRPTDDAGLERLRTLLGAGRVLVLSGAGLSTESGIPDYRGPSGAARRNHTPMTYQLFVSDPVARHRYWARSYLGWRQIADARPNRGHYAVADLQARGAISAVITQNVDGLHQAAGARAVVELHGGLDRVRCLDCGQSESRAQVDRRLRQANPDFAARAETVNPDGDVEVAEAELDRFNIVDCRGCGGRIKPDVVFFGESVPKERVARCFELVESAAALLVLGSSLTVMSGLRFVRQAARLGRPIVIVNQGPTRGDELATHCIDAPLGATLARLTPAHQ